VGCLRPPLGTAWRQHTYRQQPAVVAWGPNRLDIVVVSGDRALYHKAWNGSQCYPRPQAGSAGRFHRDGSSPVITSWGLNRLDIAVVCGDRSPLPQGMDWSGWGPYEGLGGVILDGSSPAMASWGPDRLDIGWCTIKPLPQGLERQWLVALRASRRNRPRRQFARHVSRGPAVSMYSLLAMTRGSAIKPSRVANGSHRRLLRAIGRPFNPVAELDPHNGRQLTLRRCLGAIL